MKRLWQKRWLFLLAVALAAPLLAFWAGLFPTQKSVRQQSVPALISALQTKDSSLNALQLATWRHLPGWVRTHCSSLEPVPASEVRRRACVALAVLGPKAEMAIPCLAQALRDPSLDVRLEAVGALKAIGPAANGVRGALLSMLHDPAYRPRPPVGHGLVADAALALAVIAPREPEVASALLAFIDGASMQDQPAQIAVELIRHTPDALPTFQTAVELVQDVDKASLVPALAESYLEPASRQVALATLLDYLDYGIRLEATRLLGELGPHAAPAVPRLLELFRATLAEPEPPRTETPMRWGALAPKPTIPLPAPPTTNPPSPAPAARAGFAFRLALAHGTAAGRSPVSTGLHEQVILALGKIGPAAREAIPLLEREYQSPTNRLRLVAAVARARIDANCAETMPILAAGLDAPGVEQREQALVCLAQLAGTCDEALGLLIKALADPEKRIRVRAIACLTALGHKGAVAVPALRGLASDPVFSVRIQAAAAIQAIEAK